MIDIHTHVIPYVDDGSLSLDDSIAMIKEEMKQGVYEIICTPHYDIRRYAPTKENIIENYNLLQAEVIKQELNVKLYLGQEIYFYQGLDLIKKLKNKELFTLKDSKFILLEFDLNNKPIDFTDLIYNIKINGFIPIIAHVERYNWITSDMVEKMLIDGALMQVNSDSLISKQHKYVHKRAQKFIKAHYIHFIASDIHVFRKNYMKKAIKKYRKYINPIVF